MKREDKCKLAIEKGFTYDPETGNIFGIKNKLITGKTTYGYIQLGLLFENKQYKLFSHQFAWYWVNGECVDCIDHINGIKTDNRICNLRSVTHQKNMWNKKKVKGYYWNKQKNKWMARIQVNGKNIILGLFEKEDDAKSSYLKAKEKYHII